MQTAETAVYSLPPAPPTPEVAAYCPPPWGTVGLGWWKFPFRRTYSNLYTNRHERFVLRVEHLSDMTSAVRAHHRESQGRTPPLSLSDIVNAALDLAFEHPLAFHPHVNPERLSQELGKEYLRKAFLHFNPHETA